MECLNCRHENPEPEEICTECGHSLRVLCDSCGRVNPPGSNFCNTCGLDLRKPRETPSIDPLQPRAYTPKFLADKILKSRSSIEGERKLVTVFFADVADYTAMSERLDPEDVHRIMNGCFGILMDEIHRFEGTINQFTGDGVMALFGAPVTHEDHTQRACHAALAIQKALEGYGEKVKREHGVEFRMRIGLNSGQVIVGAVGDDLRMDYMAIGDTTNLAARMERMAGPGTIWVSKNTYKLARDFFAFEPLGKVRVKGKKEPQEVYELVVAGEVETRIEAAAAKGLTQFVERRREMETLEQALLGIRSGAGRTVGIVGDAGVGKSRFLLEFRNRLPVDEYTYLAGRCLHYGDSLLYVPILDVLKDFFGIREGEPEQSVNRKVRERLGRFDKSLFECLPPLQDLLSLKVEDDAYLRIDPQQRRQMTFEAIRDVLIRASEETPLILAVEDLHWIDRTSQDFLDFFAQALAEASILLILLYRPEYRHHREAPAYLFEIALDQLSPKKSSELVQAILEGGQVGHEVRELVLDRAGGNPLFVEELTFSLLENGSIRKEDDQYVLGREASEIRVPDTVQGIIAARMDRLEEDLKGIMQIASVIGREFPFRILEKIAGEGKKLDAPLRDLQNLEFVYRNQGFPESAYIFKHALTQEVAYSSLLLTRRRKIHEEVGKTMEGLYPQRLEEVCELLAYHYVRSDNTVKAVEYLGLANQKAAKASAMEEAKTYFDRAMELLDTLPEAEENLERRISLLVNQHLVFGWLLRLTEYHELLDRYAPLVANLEDQGIRGAFCIRLGGCEWAFGDLDKAAETLTKGTRLCEAAGDTEEVGVGYYVLGYVHLARGDYDRVFELKEDLLRMGENGFHLRRYVRAFCISSEACSELGLWDEAIELGQKALNKARGFSDNALVSWSAWTISFACTHKRDLNRAMEYGELAAAMAPTPAEDAFAQTYLAWTWCHRGEPERGIEVLEGFLTIYRSVHYVVRQLLTMQFLGEGYWLGGQFDKAAKTAQELLELAERCGARGHVGKAHRLLGEVALKTDPKTAGPHFDRAIWMFREKRAENELALAYAGMGRYLKQRGDLERARDYLTQALEIFERLGTLIEPDKARQELAGLPREA